MKSTDALIDRLVHERPPRAPYRPFGLRGIALAVGAFAIAVAIARSMRFREPIAAILGSPREGIEIAILAGFLVLAVVFALGTGIPGWTERRPRLTRVLLATFAVASASLLVRVGEGAMRAPFYGTWGVSCALLFAGVAGGSALLLLRLQRRGTITRPALAAWGATLFGCAMGLLVLELHCGDESASHLLVGHFGGLLAFALLFAPPTYRRLASRD